MLLARVPGLAAEIAKGAAQRDLDRELPFAAFAAFRASGLGALRIPVALGGPGGSVADYIEVIETLAAADSNVAHALRSHFNFTESIVLDPTAPKASFALSKVLEGAIFGGAHTEQGTARPGMVTTTLTKVGDTYRLNGKKWYATGTAFSDYASFSANGDDGSFVSVLLPTNRAGIHILDDWDGMGQRLTASGGVELDNVEVFPNEIAPRQLNNLIGRIPRRCASCTSPPCAAGVVRNVLSDAEEYVQKQARSAAHSHAEVARRGPISCSRSSARSPPIPSPSTP